MPDTPVGTTVSAGTTGFNAEVTSLSLDGPSRESIDASHFGTVDAKSFEPADLRDAGSVSLTVHFDQNNTTVWTGKATETWTIEWPEGSDWEFEGFVTEEPMDATDIDGKMTQDITIKVDGSITRTVST